MQRFSRCALVGVAVSTHAVLADGHDHDSHDHDHDHNLPLPYDISAEYDSELDKVIFDLMI